jgi:electron transport complex protein RnfA
MLGTFALLGVFSGLAMNMILHCGLAMREAARVPEPGLRHSLVKAALVFGTVVFLWLVFTSILSRFPLGFYEYLLMFPLSALVYACLGYFFGRFVLKKKNPGAGIDFCDGLAAASLFVTLNTASSFSEALVLSLGFSLGILFVLLVLGEIHRRSMLEAAPRFLRGSPLIIVSMGLLSLIFSSAALMFFRALGG